MKRARVKPAIGRAEGFTPGGDSPVGGGAGQARRVLRTGKGLRRGAGTGRARHPPGGPGRPGFPGRIFPACPAVPPANPGPKSLSPLRKMRREGGEKMSQPPGGRKQPRIVRAWPPPGHQRVGLFQHSRCGRGNAGLRGAGAVDPGSLYQAPSGDLRRGARPEKTAARGEPLK